MKKENIEIINRILNLFSSTNKGDYPLEMEIGLSRTSIQNWRNHNSKPGTDALIKIANYFNVSVDYLVGRETPTAKKEINAPNKAINSTLLNRIESLDELQQAKVMAYIDGLQDTNSSIKNAFYNGVNKEKNKQTLQVNTKLHNENI